MLALKAMAIAKRKGRLVKRNMAVEAPCQAFFQTRQLYFWFSSLTSCLD
jgi:hypothetical protein